MAENEQNTGWLSRANGNWVQNNISLLTHRCAKSITGAGKGKEEQVKPALLEPASITVGDRQANCPITCQSAPPANPKSLNQVRFGGLFYAWRNP